MIKKNNFSKLLIFLIFVLLPFGQLPGFLIDRLVKISFTIHPIDIVVIILGLINFNLKLARAVIFVSLFSLALSLGFFDPGKVVFGSLYLIRFIFYLTFPFVIRKYVGEDVGNKKSLVNLLVAIGVVIAIIGFCQYLFFPDLRSLKYFGWDDHYFRLFGAFLDPAFMGIMLALAILASLFTSTMWVTLLMTVALSLTYSRASYLSLIIGLIVLSCFKKSFVKSSLAIIIFLLLSMPLLPRPKGEGVNLLRTNSIVQKNDNLGLSYKIVSKYPVFGVGFNNICQARSLIEKDLPVNSCSGLDNSMLFIVATTGAVGAMIFVSFGINLWVKTKKNNSGLLFKVSLVAVIVHSQFTNTLFYNFILLWLGILIGISRNFKENS